MEKLNRIIESYPPELKFLLVCCGSERWKAEDLLPDINWELFLQWVKRHRVNPHVYQFGIKNSLLFPTEILKQINETQKVNTQRMLRLTGEMLRLQKLFNDNNINNIPFKGPALAYQLYNDPGMRHSIDLDFLILPENFESVSTILISEGYKQINPDFSLSPKQKKVQLTTIHHANFINLKVGLSVEIHWRLITPSTLLPDSEKLFFELTIPKQPFAHIKSELLLHFLIVHGAKHKWNKLFWLYDINEFIKLNLITECNYFNKLTVLFKDDRMVNQSFRLSELLFHSQIPSVLKQNIYPEKLILIALIAIKVTDEKLFQNNIDKIKWLLYLIRLKPGFKHLRSSINAHITNYKDWDILKIPDNMFFLYYPLRPFLWIWSVFYRQEKKA